MFEVAYECNVRNGGIDHVCICGDSTLLVLNGTSLNSDSALLALNWRYAHVCVCTNMMQSSNKVQD